MIPASFVLLIGKKRRHLKAPGVRVMAEIELPYLAPGLLVSKFPAVFLHAEKESHPPLHVK